MSWMPEGKRLLVFFGMIASGKSYLAKACAEQWSCPYYNSDIVRKELAGVAVDSRQNNAYDSGIYSRGFSRRTYDALIALARKGLGEKEQHLRHSRRLVPIIYRTAAHLHGIRQGSEGVVHPMSMFRSGFENADGTEAGRQAGRFRWALGDISGTKESI